MKPVQRHSFLSSLVMASALVLLSACETVQTTQGGAVGVDRQQRMMISAQELDRAANKQYGELIAAEKKKGNLNRNAAQVERVKAISNLSLIHI